MRKIFSHWRLEPVKHCLYVTQLPSRVKNLKTETDAIFNLNKSKMIIMILLAIYNADKFSEL